MDTQNPNAMTSMPKKSSLGPVIGLIIILAIIVVGSLYFWGERVNDMGSYGNTYQNSEEQGADYQTQQLQTQGSSDELDSIEADLNATTLTDIDAGAEDLE